MIDINNTLDLIKIKFYNEWLYSSHVLPADEEAINATVTEKVVSEFIDPLNIPKDSIIMDMGCGSGYFLDQMKERGYTNVTGVTLVEEDKVKCSERGHNVKTYDFSFIPQKDGYWDESVDFIFFRQGLQSSPYPIFTLMEYNRILKQNGLMYVEVPAPDCERNLEELDNNYSILGQKQLAALLKRTGFEILSFKTLEFNGSKDEETFNEKYFSLIVRKKQPIDVK